MVDIDLVEKVRSFEAAFFRELERGLEHQECIKVIYSLLREQSLISGGVLLEVDQDNTYTSWTYKEDGPHSFDVSLKNLESIHEMIGRYEAQQKIKEYHGIENDYYSGPEESLSDDKRKDVDAYLALVADLKRYLSEKLQPAEKNSVQQDQFEKTLDLYFSEKNPFEGMEISVKRMNTVKRKIKEALMNEYISSGHIIPAASDINNSMELFGRV